jgi:hypothetical protein
MTAAQVALLAESMLDRERESHTESKAPVLPMEQLLELAAIGERQRQEAAAASKPPGGAAETKVSDG